MTHDREKARWLLGELDGWRDEGIVSAEGAAVLRGRYGTEAEEPAVSLRSVFLAALGALLVGGGVILLVAHNWSELGRGARTVLSLLPLLLAQAAGTWVLLRRPGSRPWNEGVSLALPLAVATSIALVQQTYQVPGDFHQLLFLCVLLTLPLLYLFDGVGVAALYLAGIGFWAVSAPRSDPPVLLLYLLLLGAAALPLYRRLEPGRPGATLVGWALVGSLLLAWVPVTETLRGRAWIPYNGLLFASLFVLGCLRDRRGGSPDTPWPAPLRLAGVLGLLTFAFVATYSAVWEKGVRWSGRDAAPVLADLVLYGILLVMLLGVVAWMARTLRRGDRVSAWLVSLPVWLLAGWGLNRGEGFAEPLALCFNAYVAVLGLLLMVTGLREGRLGRANAGLAVLTLLVILRFFDSDLSILARGVGFVVAGLAFLAANQWLDRRLRRRDLPAGDAPEGAA